MKGPREPDEFVYAVGASVLLFIGAMHRLGWSTPQGSLPYFTFSGSPADVVIDLVRWGAGDRDAKERLQSIGPEWSKIGGDLVAETLKVERT
jgi:hypothetical protein